MENPHLSQDVARAAYSAYGDALNWKNSLGLPMAQWNELGERLRNAWLEAGTAAALRFSREMFRSSDTK